jgi:hypothetical protein
MAFRSNGGFVHFVCFWHLAFGTWHLARVRGTGTGTETGTGTGTGTETGTGACSRMMMRGWHGNPVQVGIFSFRQDNGHSQKPFPGEFVYHLGDPCVMAQGGETRGGRRSKVFRPASAGTQWAGDTVPPIPARGLGPDEDRARPHDTRGRSAILPHGGF